MQIWSEEQASKQFGWLADWLAGWQTEIEMVEIVKIIEINVKKIDLNRK